MFFETSHYIECRTVETSRSNVINVSKEENKLYRVIFDLFHRWERCILYMQSLYNNRSHSFKGITCWYFSIHMCNIIGLCRDNTFGKAGSSYLITCNPKLSCWIYDIVCIMSHYFGWKNSVIKIHKFASVLSMVSV